MYSAFGVDHGYSPISKDLDPDDIEQMKRDKIPEGYRPSALQDVNPRSRTYVKEGGGSLARRVGSQYGGALAGTLILPGPGTAVGATVGGSRNVKSGDTIGIRRKDGARAKSKVALSGTEGFYIYPPKKSKKD